MSKEIIVELNRDDFSNLLNEISSVLVIYFTADWCKPCGLVKTHIRNHMTNLPDEIICAELDVDNEENIDLFAYMKRYKQLVGIPSLLMFHKEFESSALASVSGADKNKINYFFKEVLNKHTKLMENN